MKTTRRLVAVLLILTGLFTRTATTAHADCGSYPTEYGSLCAQGVPLFACSGTEGGEPDNWHFLGCWGF